MNIGSPPIKNHNVKHWLRKWYRLDTNVNDLNQTQIIQMKILYSALRHLSKDKIKFLADKYRVNQRHYNSDKVMAERYNMNLKDYKTKRIEIESELSPILGESSKQYREEIIKAAAVEYMKR